MTSKNLVAGSSCFVASLLCLAAGFWIPSNVVPPTIKISPIYIQLGEVSPGEKVASRIKVVNTYGLPIRRMRVLTSCICSTAEIEHQSLPLMGETWINLEIDIPSKIGGFSSMVMLVYETSESGGSTLGKRIPIEALVKE